MKILVTGASGFIGFEMIKEFKSKFDIFALTRNENIKADKDVKILVGDVSENLPELPKVDIVLHFAGITSIGSTDPNEYIKVNVVGTYNLLKRMQESGIKKMIFISTADMYDQSKLYANEKDVLRPETPYTTSKVIAESFCRYFADHLGFKIIVLRYSGVYGINRPKGLIYDTFQNSIKNNPIKILSNPNNQFDSVYIKDIVKNMYQVLNFIQTEEQGFDIFNIGYGNPIIVRNVIDEIIRLSKSRSKIEYSDKPADKNFCMDIEKAKKILSFTPTNIEVSLTDYYHELVDNIKRGS